MVKSRTFFCNGSSRNHCLSSSVKWSRVHWMARSANSLKSLVDKESDACSSWLPFTTGQSSSRMRSTHSCGFALYPKMSPRQTKCVHLRLQASGSPALSASQLEWVDLYIADHMGVGSVI